MRGFEQQRALTYRGVSAFVFPGAVRTAAAFLLARVDATIPLALGAGKGRPPIAKRPERSRRPIFR